MSASPCRMFTGCRQSVLLIRVVGRGNSQGCPALRQLAEQRLASGIDRVQIDLAECTHLDSTFVGTLLFLAKHPRLRERGRLQLVRPSPECLQVLKQMSVGRLFDICDSVDYSACEWQELGSDMEPLDRSLFRQNVVEAHEHLAAVPGPLSDCFRAIAEAGRQELDMALQKERNG